MNGLTRHFLIELGFKRGPEPIAERPDNIAPSKSDYASATRLRDIKPLFGS